MKGILESINNIVWGPPLLILLVGTGIYLTIRLKLLQVFKLPLALKYVFGKDEEANDEEAHGDVIKVGGPGALLWMWLAAFFGMATKYAEGVLAIKYRVKDENGEMAGGPMYYIEKGLGLKWLAKIFAVLGVGVAFLGIGTFAQVNSIASGLKETFNVPLWITAIVITVIVALVTLGGIKRISKVSESVVPFMAVLYIVGALIVLLCNISAIPSAISLISNSSTSVFFL